MGIVTKRGDAGYTSLYFGGRARKDSPRVELIGALDEISSFLGLSKDLARSGLVKRMLDSVQKDLIILSAEAATEIRSIKRLKARIDASHIKRLEREIVRLERLSPCRVRRFQIPGGGLESSSLDVARAIARRAERRACALRGKRQLSNPDIAIYLNRLSDLLYMLARASSKR